MIPDIWGWLTSSWGGADGIATRMLEHLLYSGAVLAIACVVGIPLGLWIGHSGRGRWLISLANAARAVPTLGLLFALALWLGPHISGSLAFVVPSVAALTLLAIPPVLAGSYAGVEAIDPPVRDAARAMGMSRRAVVTQVEIPNALPLMLSGVRSAVLQVVATATIAAYIGLGGLGRFLIDGLASADYAQTAGGAILVAVLALVLDLILAGIQRLLVSPGLRGGRRSLRRAMDPRSGDTGESGFGHSGGKSAVRQPVAQSTSAP